MPLGDVARIDDDRVDAARVHERAPHDLEQTPRSVAALEAQLDRLRRLRISQLAPGELARTREIFGMHESGERQRFQLAVAVSECARSGWTVVTDGAVRLDDAEDVVGVLDDGAEEL